MVIETALHVLERAHFYYGLPHMFHDASHWVLKGIMLYRLGAGRYKLKGLLVIFKRVQKFSKNHLCILKR